MQKRIEALQRKIDNANLSHRSQVVIYNPLTGQPLNEPDPGAKQIWMADDGRGLDRPTR